MKKNSKKISKIIAPLALAGGCLATMPATSCGSSSMYSNVKTIAPFLHEITYDDYREDTDYETIKEAEAFGCSSVRCGNYYGRNFDYVYNDTPEFIVHVKANEKKSRHASLAVSTHFGLREDKMLKGKYDKQLELIPNLTMDGINDAGVICSSNVVSMESDNKKLIKPETRPGEGLKNLHVLFIPRFVLDNANSALDAIHKLQQVNVMGNLNDQMYIHVMIADATSTYVVEFFRDTESKHNHFDVVYEEKKDIEQIMTNHFVNLDNHKSFINDEKFGNERYEILKDCYPKTPQEKASFNFDDMTALMKTVKFSQAYDLNKSEVPMNTSHDPYTANWYSEKLTQSFIETYGDSQHEVEWNESIESLRKFKLDYWDAIKNNRRAEANPGYWITTHNSTYDMSKKRLRIIVQEDYDHPYDYYL